MKLNLCLVMVFGLLLSACASNDLGVDAFKNVPAEKILAAGQKALAKGNYEDAIKRFEAIESLYPFSAQVQQAQLAIIYAYNVDSNYESAVAAADRYIHLYPHGKHTDYVYYLKGRMNFERGGSWLQKLYPMDVEKRDVVYLKEAFIGFNDLIRLFPASPYIKDAQMRMVYIRNMLAQYELGIAKFYLERKSYVAAINRAHYVIKHFDQTPQMIDALQVLVTAYNAIGEHKHADDAARILKLNSH